MTEGVRKHRSESSHESGPGNAGGGTVRVTVTLAECGRLQALACTLCLCSVFGGQSSNAASAEGLPFDS
jgi:hypothetical protein